MLKFEIFNCSQTFFGLGHW